MDATNPVVMLNATIWHIVESGRASDVALCGLPLRQRRAHSRLRTIGRDNVCPDCLRALEKGARG
jgi:hypothetical protein